MEQLFLASQELISMRPSTDLVTVIPTELHWMWIQKLTVVSKDKAKVVLVLN
jgi:hypothetical protein